MHKNALANSEAICTCEKLMEYFRPCFNSGIPSVMNSGNRNAKSIIFGNNDWKNSLLSLSSQIYNEKEYN